MTHAASPYVRYQAVSGGVASVHVCDEASPATLVQATDEAFAELERLEQIFSTLRPDSEISQVNRGERSVHDCSPEVAEVLDACTWLEHESGGAFSIRPPGRPGVLDPAGFVTGWAGQQAGRVLAEAGLRHWSVNVGGDLQASGTRTPDRPWSIAVNDPIRREAVLASIELSGAGAVATSGTAERGEHLWRASTSDPELLAVTVTGPELAWADAFATTALALGGAGLDWIERVAASRGYQAFAVWANHTVRTTSSCPAQFFGAGPLAGPNQNGETSAS
jgi:thiamine biosynthesis lipoprotein